MLFKKEKSPKQTIGETHNTGIKTGQILELNNVLCYRATMGQQELAAALQQISEVVNASGAKKDGYTVTATHSIQEQDGQQIVDMEINIPLDKPIEAEAPFEFISEFTISKAVVVRHEGNPQGLEPSAKILSYYITENNLQPTTPIYNVTVRDAFTIEEVGSMIIDLYVGVE